MPLSYFDAVLNNLNKTCIFGESGDLSTTMGCFLLDSDTKIGVAFKDRGFKGVLTSSSSSLSPLSPVDALIHHNLHHGHYCPYHLPAYEIQMNLLHSEVEVHEMTTLLHSGGGGANEVLATLEGGGTYDASSVKPKGSCRAYDVPTPLGCGGVSGVKPKVNIGASPDRLSKESCGTYDSGSGHPCPPDQMMCTT
ncbi:hypothetical protein M9H77_31277 [Catharanthus roseus]|uniref:Uncharacterized protein n=1 Tax=Catharanthus roseus TaxID=4058 RepID=A0ACC0A0P3_CATRO|nr:hypothetical protein M9H77_31277 [Catharanthus roseus]